MKSCAPACFTSAVSIRLPRWLQLVFVLAATSGAFRVPSPLRAQPAGARDSLTVAKALAGAKGAERIPPLVELAGLTRDDPKRALQLADEALALLSRDPSPRSEVRARLARAFALQLQGDYPPALAEAERAQRLTSGWIADGTDAPASDGELVADALYHVGLVQWRMASYPAAIASAERARLLLEPLGNSATLAKTLSLVGAIHAAQSRNGEAMQAYLASLRVSEALGDEIAMGRVHNNIGLVLLDLGRKTEAYDALMRALAIHERRGTRQFLVNTLNNVGFALIEMERPRDALPYLQRALAIDLASGNRYGEAKEYSNIGGVYEMLNDLKLALSYQQRALAIREAIGDKDGIVRTRGALAELRMRMGDPRAAIPLLEGAVALAGQINDRRDEAEQLEVLSRARAAVGDTAGAYREFQRYHALISTLNDSTLHRQIAELEARYQSLARQRELAQVSALAESRRSKLQGLIVGSALLAACLTLLAVLYVWRGRAQAALRESEHRYRALFQASALPTFLLEVAAQRLVDCNAPARAIVADALRGDMAVRDLEPQWVRRALTRSLETADGDGATVDDVWTGAGGETRWTEVRGSRVSLGGRDCLLVTVRDATEERRRDEARQREEKLQSLGVLAGGIAHDFNNALTAIMGHITLARQADDTERDEMLGGAEAAARGAARLTAQLLAFAKGGKPVRRSADLARLVRDAASLAGAGSHMRIEFDLPDDLWPSRVDSGQFSQVVSNIVINAQQATGEGGRLLVRATNVTGDLPVALGLSTSLEAAGREGATRYVRIDFEDNGTGIPEAIRSRVFDPYFTTKSAGSGLGLATAFAICRNHGGTLTFETRDGVGTTFSAYFPATTEAPAPPAPRSAESPDGSGRILVLDDEPLVRKILTRMLSQWGFDVEDAADGQVAVERYLERQREGRPFDLLIMDLTIPGGMGGRQAITEILRHDPRARAIVASGYSDDPTMANYREAGFLAALAKPFQREELAEVVNTVLGSERMTQAR